MARFQRTVLDPGEFPHCLGKSLPLVYLSAIRDKYSAVALYQGSGSGERPVPQRRRVTLPIPGQLAGRCPVQAGSSNQVKTLGQTVFPSWLNDEFSKVQTQPHTSIQLCDHSFQLEKE